VLVSVSGKFSRVLRPRRFGLRIQEFLLESLAGSFDLAASDSGYRSFFWKVEAGKFPVIFRLPPRRFCEAKVAGVAASSVAPSYEAQRSPFLRNEVKSSFAGWDGAESPVSCFREALRSPILGARKQRGDTPSPCEAKSPKGANKTLNRKSSIPPLARSRLLLAGGQKS
jgi:hypothetical protein